MWRNKHHLEILQEIKLWIENGDFSKPNSHVQLSRESEQAQGFTSSIIFAKCSCTCREKIVLDLVIKSSSTNEKLRKAIPAKLSSLNEIYTYENIIPKLEEISGELPFIPKYYGSILWEHREVILLENLSAQDYKVYPRKSPLEENDLRAALSALGKFHATSAAFREKNRAEFERITGDLQDVWTEFPKLSDLTVTLGEPTRLTYDLLKNDLDEESANKLQKFTHEIKYITEVLIQRKDCFSVICHSDCWINNFMFKHKGTSSDVMIIDWPNTRISSPVIDLSFCIYSSASPTDILHNFGQLLHSYYFSFAETLKKADCIPESIYKYSQLIKDWSVFGKFGLLLAMVSIKISVSDEDEVADFSKLAEVEGNISKGFFGDVRDKDMWKQRIRPVIEHALQYEVI